MPPTPEVEFPVRPVTMTMTTPEGVITRIAPEMVTYYAPEERGGVTVAKMIGPYDYRVTFLSEVTVNLPGQLEGVAWSSGYPVQFRETNSSDVIAAEMTTYPWPLPVIRAFVNDKVMNVHLEALADDSGNVMTIMQVSDLGLWLRYSGAWVELMDPDVIGDWSTIDVDDTALAMYDAFDQSGQVTTVFALPVKDPMDLGPFRGQVTAPEEGLAGAATLTSTDLPQEDPVEQDLGPVQMPVIETARDIPAAIEVAEAHPEHRWYVERRLHAMGLDDKLPWQTDE